MKGADDFSGPLNSAVSLTLLYNNLRVVIPAPNSIRINFSGNPS